ncbi:hypothetical protein ADM96_15600 [Burkholderia sp. ST111]|nr:hypothetical protein ADM96_15600 [Burkholderia sp. ST111]
MGLPEHAPIANYVAHQIRQLVADYIDLQCDEQTELLRFWSTGFEKGIRQRVQTQVRNSIFMQDHNVDWAQAEAKADDAAAARAPIIGTLHLPRKAKIDGGQS